MAAGLVTLEKIAQSISIKELSAKTEFLVNGIKEIMQKNNTPFITNCLGGMFGLFLQKIIL